MSVIALRTCEPKGVGFSPSTLSLRNLQVLLQAAESRAKNSGGGVIYHDLVLFTLVLVNAVLNDRALDQSTYAFACQAGSYSLSVASSLQKVTKDIKSINEQDSRYLDTLHPYLKAMEETLGTAVQALARKQTDAPTLLTFFQSSGIGVEIDRASAALRRSFNALTLKISVFAINGVLPSRKTDADGLVLHYDQITLRDKYQAAKAEEEPDRPGADNFWDNTYQGTVDGRRSIIKTYPKRSIKIFRRDLEIMKKARHSNLPSLLGYSKQGASDPFIAMTMESCIPPHHYFTILCDTAPNSALRETWSLILAVRSTAEYLIRQGLIGTADEIEDVIENAVVDNTGKMILAPRASATTWKRYNRSNATQVLKWLSEDFERNVLLFFEKGENIGLPPILLPVLYTLQASDDVPLPPSGVRVDETIARLLEPSHRRLLPDKAREVTSILSIFGSDYQPAVGDIGRFTRHANGHRLFVPLVNILHQIGGYVAQLVQDLITLSHTDSGFRGIPHDGEYGIRWGTEIPVEPGLKYLSDNAWHYAKLFGVPPGDLVLITRTGVRLSHLKPEVQRREEIHVYWDEYRRFLRWAKSTPSTPGPTPEANDTTVAQPLPFQQSLAVEIRSVQIEEKGLNLDGKPTATSSSSPPEIGDIGYFDQRTDGSRFFRVICNATADLQRFDLEPWERNQCEDIGGGVWRSHPMLASNDVALAFTWTLKGWIDLPLDVVAFYLYSLATDGGTVKLPCANDDLQMVSQVFLQVQAKFSSQANNMPLRLFVHFDKRSIPMYAYWSESDQPCRSTSEIQQYPGCITSIRPSIMTMPEYYQFLSGRTRVSQEYQPTGQHTLQSKPRLVQRIGELAHRPRDSDGHPTDYWHALGNMALPTRIPVLSDSLGDLELSKTSDNTWRGRIPWSPEYPSTSSAYATWIEELPRACPLCLSQLAKETAEKSNVPREDIQLVSKIAMIMRASVSPVALIKNEWLVQSSKTFLYKRKMKSRADGDESASRDPAESDEGIINRDDSDALDEPELGGIGPDDEDYFHDLQLYVVFPPEGGCYGIWSKDTAPSFGYRALKNYRVLSRLDLQGWQLPGCHVRTSFEVERVSINELCARNELLEPGPMLHLTGENEWEFRDADYICGLH